MKGARKLTNLIVLAIFIAASVLIGFFLYEANSHLRKQRPDIWALLYMDVKHRLQLLLIPGAGPKRFGCYIYLIVGAYRLQKTKRAACIKSSSNHLQKKEID